MSEQSSEPKKTVEEYVAEYNALVEYANSIQRSIENLSSLAREAETTKNELTQLEQGEKPAEILVPLGPLAFIRAKVESVDTVIVNLGAGVYREVSVSEAISRVEDYIKGISGEIEKLTTLYQQVAARIAQLERDLSKTASQQPQRKT